MNNETVFALTDKAATKALANAEFRKALVKDANSAIKLEFDEDISTKVTFHEFSDKKWVFVLPAKADTANLSADDLEAVSGGAVNDDMDENPFLQDNEEHNLDMAYACFPNYHNDLHKVMNHKNIKNIKNIKNTNYKWFNE